MPLLSVETTSHSTHDLTLMVLEAFPITNKDKNYI